MKEEEHSNAYKEHRSVVDWAIDKGVEQSQRTIAMHASRGAVELLSLYLHKTSKIDQGFQINHRWFKSPQAGRKLPEFEKKDVIVPKLIELENRCENLTYGSQKPASEIKDVIELFNEVEKLLNGLIGDERRN